MEMFWLALAVGAMNILCFLVGVNVRQKVDNGEKVKVTPPNPVAVVQEHKSRVAANKEQERLEAIIQNMENSDGYGGNQKEIPR